MNFMKVVMLKRLLKAPNMYSTVALENIKTGSTDFEEVLRFDLTFNSTNREIAYQQTKPEEN